MTVTAPAPTYLGPAAHTSAGNNKPINRVVIHSTVGPSKAGSARGIASYFRSKASGGSAHYVVDAAEVVQVVYDGVIAWHAPPNANSLGVEMCDNPSTTNLARWNDADHKAVLDRTAALVAQLCLAYNVPLTRLTVADVKAGKHGICGHADVSQAFHQSDHWDPGAFPWDRFMSLVHEHADALKAGKPAARPVVAPAAKPAVPAKPSRFSVARKILQQARANPANKGKRAAAAAAAIAALGKLP